MRPGGLIRQVEFDCRAVGASPRTGRPYNNMSPGLRPVLGLAIGLGKYPPHPPRKKLWKRVDFSLD